MPDAVPCVLTGDPLRAGSRARRARLRPPTGTQGRSPAPPRPPAGAPSPAPARPPPARVARLGKAPARPGAKAQGKRQPARSRPGKASGPPPGLANGPEEGARQLSAGAGMMREGYRARETFTSAPIAYPCGKRSSANHRAKRRETVSTCASASVFPARTIRTRQRCTLGITARSFPRGTQLAFVRHREFPP